MIKATSRASSGRLIVTLTHPIGPRPETLSPSARIGPAIRSDRDLGIALLAEGPELKLELVRPRAEQHLIDDPAPIEEDVKFI